MTSNLICATAQRLEDGESCVPNAMSTNVHQPCTRQIMSTINNNHKQQRRAPEGNWCPMLLDVLFDMQNEHCSAIHMALASSV